MKRTPIALLGAALALSSTAALAAAGDRWHGSNRYDYSRTEPVEVTRVAPAEVLAYEERYERTYPAPVYVEREYRYEYEPREVYVYRDNADYTKPLNPQTGHYIGRGLFNKRGPNDFGS